LTATLSVATPVLEYRASKLRVCLSLYDSGSADEGFAGGNSDLRRHADTNLAISAAGYLIARSALRECGRGMLMHGKHSSDRHPAESGKHDVCGRFIPSSATNVESLLNKRSELGEPFQRGWRRQHSAHVLLQDFIYLQASIACVLVVASIK